MFFIPGAAISVATFPGVIIHELAHQFFCWLMKIPVLQVKYFRLENPCGYVVHEPTDKAFANFVISVGPFIVNTILGALVLSSTSIEIMIFQHFQNIFSLIQTWLGISILMHAFPSTGDANALIATILKNEQVGILAKILTAPVIALIYIGSIGSVVWLDLGYALFIGLLMPKLIMLFI